MARTVTANISQSALLHNLKRVKELAPNAKVIAMVKANAYGHGLGLVSKTLANEVDAFGVASIHEGLRLRQHGIQKEVVLVEGVFSEAELPVVQADHFTLVVHHEAQITALREYSGELKGPFNIWVKINTGMNRLGFSKNTFEDAYRSLLEIPHVNIKGFMTHFQEADDELKKTTLEQTALFQALVDQKKGWRSLANSAGILKWPQTHADWVRPGLMLYGASPFSNVSGSALGLKPAMTLSANVIATHSLKPGERVGYNGIWQATQETTRIAIVGMGYGDGYPRHAENGTPVLVNGQRAFLSGRVSMDMMAVDISHLKDVQVGDEVIFWGAGLAIEEVSNCADTIPYELFCHFTERVTLKAVH